jgi:HTH-type transcriptional regulator, sugar sensing transcriptional regulator
MNKEGSKKPKNKVQELLEFAGFSDKEIAIYLSLLELGKGTVTEVSRKSGVGRTYCYVILNELITKNLISASGREPKQEFIAESPIKLQEYLENKLSAQQKNFSEIKEVIPDLISQHQKGDRPRVRFYEGVEGMKKVYEDTLTSHETIRAYATYDDMHKALPNYFPEYYKRRAEKGIFARGIVPATPLAYERLAEDKNEARELALVPADKYLFSPDIEIYDNKVMIASWREKLGIIIESAEIADAMKKIYELAWAEAKRLDGEVKK